MAVEPVQRRRDSRRLREQQRREQEPRRLPLLAGVGGPVEIDPAPAGAGMRRAGGADEAGDLLAGLLLDAQQHQEGAELLGQRLARQDHRHRLLGLVGGQRARQRLAAPEQPDEAREGMGRRKHAAGSPGKATGPPYARSAQNAMGEPAWRASTKTARPAP